MAILPAFLCHYYDAADGPLRNLSDLPEAEARAVLEDIRLRGTALPASARKITCPSGASSKTG